MALVGKVLAALERAPAWASGYTHTACDAAAALWLVERPDYASVIERALQNVVAIDFRCPMRDARLGLAQLCALQGRYDEAVESPPLYRFSYFARSCPLLPEDLWLARTLSQHLLVDSSKARSLLGWTETDPAEAVRRSVQWHLAHPPSDADPDFAADDRALASTV